MLKIQNLHSSIDGTPILRGVSLSIEKGSIHAIMGPNGSGKSTLASVLAGHPFYSVDAVDDHTSEIDLDGSSLISASPDERSQAGLFLAFQYPVEVPGVSVQNFLRQAHKARFSQQPEKQFSRAIDFYTYLQKLAEDFSIDTAFLKRGLNEGFSGGEKKQLEILQMAVLEPKYAILDETDSGLDIDAIKRVATNVLKIHERTGMGIVIITHYNRILEYIAPQYIHILVAGKIIQSGGKELLAELEKDGYRKFKEGEQGT